jgi:mRNA interferase YafQ
MQPIRTTRQFERDLKSARRRGKDLDKLWEIIEILNHGA